MTKTVSIDEAIDDFDTFQKRVMDELEGTIGPEVSQVMYATAVKLAPVDTGTLRHSLTTGQAIVERDDGKGEVVIGATTNIEYAPYVEYGTGTKGDPSVPHVPKDYWWSLNPEWKEGMPESKKFIRWHAQAPNPFMGKSLQATEKIAIKMMTEGVQRAFEQ